MTDTMISSLSVRQQMIYELTKEILRGEGGYTPEGAHEKATKIVNAILQNP